MKLPISLKLALNYLRPNKSTVSIINIISTLGVMLGVAVLIIVLSIMNGFGQTWKEKILSVNAHINLLPSTVEANSWKNTLDFVTSFNEVEYAIPTIDSFILMQLDNNIETPILRGIDPNINNPLIDSLRNSITEGIFSLKADEIILSKGLARKLNAKVNDQVIVTTSNDILLNNEIKFPSEINVSGIFNIGIYDIDENFAFTSLDFADDLLDLNGRITSIQLMLDDPMNAPLIAEKILDEDESRWFPQTWMDANKQIFTALQVEKNMMFFLLAFVALVAAFSVSNTLITLTVQKTKEIGLLKAIGFKEINIVSIFVWIGLIQSIIGSILGLIFALIVLKFRNEILFFLSYNLDVNLLPAELYQFSQLPCHITFNDVFIVIGMVIIFCVIAVMVPAIKAARLQPIKALNFE